MRYQGKIANWKDDQGYGFVTPNGGGQKAFVHVKYFLSHSRRPLENDLITYALAKDEQGRLYAKEIRFVGERQSKPSSTILQHIAIYFAMIFIAFLMVSVLTHKLPAIILVLYGIASLVTFIGYAQDKTAAKKNNWRIPEKTLHSMSLMGGWPGALLAQKILRHKSKKPTFQTMFWFTVVINASLMIWLIYSDLGSSWLEIFFG